MAQIIWMACVALLLAMILLCGVADLWLFFERRETISDFLRRNPDWFWLPVLIGLAAAIWLAIHLWWKPWGMGGP